MTIEQLQSEKRVLKEKIEMAVNEFYRATNLNVSGEFKTHVATFRGCVTGFVEYHTVAEVTINPIEI